MQRLTCAAWSLDDRFVYSGSDEMNIRIWKARAAEKLGVVSYDSCTRANVKLNDFSSYSRLNLVKRRPCGLTLNWWRNSLIIQPSNGFTVIVMCPVTCTIHGTNCEIAGLQPDGSMFLFLLFFNLLLFF